MARAAAHCCCTGRLHRWDQSSRIGPMLLVSADCFRRRTLCSGPSTDSGLHSAGRSDNRRNAMADELDTTQGWCRVYDAGSDLANWERSPTAGPNQKELVVGAGPPVDDGLVA